ncbi:zinc carboxypeptidase [Jejuia pallidilutea]|uniref:Zinc carboxypeptidase n=1 Tax=Jejuia pallidilutea TaxID=504487 RepID=A0A362X536_9FLAO|nr:M14 family zinc carboxypeptidase [Jejuia pallidilutea]PQV50151.1 zinc carboxypeptidase [Jejuia pallidilutea]
MFTFVDQIKLMDIKDTQALFEKHKEQTLYYRYITNEKIKPLLSKYKNKAVVKIVGKSVLGDDIFSVKIGSGPKKILMWSQMHGNESTTTKAIFDFLNTCISGNNISATILKECTLCIIPILNPDGAKAYTRVNANTVDLNRDAQDQTQPESVVLNTVFNDFKPHFCFNLHGQRTIFSAGNSNNSATISFLAPAQDKDCTVTPTRKVAMEVIVNMNKTLQELIPNQVGVYDDAFNINCVGDTFQSKNIPTILFEAGHFANDYAREKTRELIYMSYMSSLLYIAENNVDGTKYQDYFNIPENEKLFFDVIIKNVRPNTKAETIVDIAFQFEERLEHGEVIFLPIVKKIGDLTNYYAHKHIDGNGSVVLAINNDELKIDSANVFVKLNNEKIVLFVK